ncbi:Hypothetical protein R9X50_00746700 [Acrodontium crateriforme]|uniref:RNA exonuclease 4 n=1 Tax=Acrodontium crateriforme TaxID=150365 RepID=A0AAQ3RCS2_9PEZI|nr:Hypothetical protein R9X50_00746700 [Acrodontium crateriforme]
MPGIISSNWKKLQEQLKSQKPTDQPSTGLKRRRDTEKSNEQSKKPRLAKSEYLPAKRAPRRKMGSAFSSTKEDTSTTYRRSTLTSTHDIAPSDLSAAYGSDNAVPTITSSSADDVNGGLHPTHKAGRYLALDCEMVGTGPPPHEDNVLARVSLVNFHGEQIYDSFVQAPPGIRVEDYRTFVSGVRAQDMTPTYARPYAEVHRDVTALLRGRVLVGHALKNDVEVLALTHPKCDVRDTSRYGPYRVASKGKAPALRNLARDILGIEIQSGAHSSVEDARAAMALYRREKAGFERENKKKFGQARAPAKAAGGANDRNDEEHENEDVSDEEDEELETLDGEEDEDLEIGTAPIRSGTGRGTGGPAKKKKKGKKKKRTKHA